MLHGVGEAQGEPALIGTQVFLSTHHCWKAWVEIFLKVERALKHFKVNISLLDVLRLFPPLETLCWLAFWSSYTSYQLGMFVSSCRAREGKWIHMVGWEEDPILPGECWVGEVRTLGLPVETSQPLVNGPS